MAEKKLLIQCVQFMGLITKKISLSFEQMNKLCLQTIANHEKEKADQQRQSSGVRKQLIMRKRKQTNADDIIQRNQKRRERITGSKNTAKQPYTIFVEQQMPILLERYPLQNNQNLRAILSQAWQKLSKQDRQVYEKKVLPLKKNGIHPVPSKQQANLKQQKHVVQQKINKRETIQRKRIEKLKEAFTQKIKQINQLPMAIAISMSIPKKLQAPQITQKPQKNQIVQPIGVSEHPKTLKEGQIIISSDSQNEQERSMKFEPMNVKSLIQKSQKKIQGFSPSLQSDSLCQN